LSGRQAAGCCRWRNGAAGAAVVRRRRVGEGTTATSKDIVREILQVSGGEKIKMDVISGGYRAWGAERPADQGCARAGVGWAMGWMGWRGWMGALAGLDGR
jgi:hypothetical protein